MAKLDTSPSEIATNALQSLPFGSIIGAPLNACIDAQKQAALSSVAFINEVGLTTDSEGKQKAVYVSFEYRQQGRLVTLTIPLLTLVPIPYIGIKDIEIAFKANISAASSSQTVNRSATDVSMGMSASASVNVGVFKASTSFNASVSSKKDSTATRDSKYSVEYTMDVSVRAGQEDIPAGTAKILEMLNESIDAVDTNGELNVTENRVVLENGNPNGIFITYKNTEGFYAPEEITVVNENGSSVPDSKCKLTEDEIGMLCMFFETGTYLVKAGKKKIGILVSQSS